MPDKKTLKKLLLVVLTVAAVGLLVYFLVVRPIQVRQEKKQFEQAAAELEKLYGQIEAVAGKPDEVKREKSCDRANLKISQGPLSCNVNVALEFATDLNASNEKLQKISDLYPASLKSASGLSRSNNFVVSDSSKEAQVYYQDLEIVQGLECFISYRYPVLTDGTGIRLNLSCGKSALAEHYPLRN